MHPRVGVPAPNTPTLWPLGVAKGAVSTGKGAAWCGPPGNGNAAQAGNLDGAEEKGNQRGSDFNQDLKLNTVVTKAENSVTKGGVLACHNCRAFQPRFPLNPNSAYGTCRRGSVHRGGRAKYQPEVHRAYHCHMFVAIAKGSVS